MSKLEIENLGNELIVTLKPDRSFWNKILQGILAPLCMFSGLRMVWLYFFQDGQDQFRMIVSAILCFYLGVYYGKKALWNFFGKEIMHLKSNQFSVYNDFKFYKKNAFGNNFEKFKVDYITYASDEKKMLDYEVVDAEMAGRENVSGVLVFYFDNFRTESETSLDEIELLRAVREIRSFYQQEIS